MEFVRITGDDAEKTAHLSALASSIIREYYDPLLGKAQNEYKKAKDALKEEAEDLQKTVEKAAEAESEKK